MYRTGPGYIPPFGCCRVPPHGYGFEIPKYTRPAESTEGGYQAPPPEDSCGNRNGFSIVSKRQRTTPVCRSSAKSVPRPPAACPFALV